MTHWLLKNEGYPPAVIVSVLLHLLLLWLIFFWSREAPRTTRLEPPVIVATTVKENPQRVARQEQLELLRKQQQVAREHEKSVQEEKQRLADRIKQEQQAKAEAEQQKLVQKKLEQVQQQNRRQEEERQRLAKEQEQKKNKEKQQQAAQEQSVRNAELAKQQAAVQKALTEEEQLVAKYAQIIKDLITQNWRFPANAKNGMKAVIELRMTPTGEIISKSIVTSSGDALFDRSVVQAVEKVGSFPELQDVPVAVFERHFRTFSLEFHPEDLLR